jgi:hypothetical protein
MSRFHLPEQLARADVHILVGANQIARQKKLIQRLRDGGHSTAIAESLLYDLQKSQEIHVAAGLRPAAATASRRQNRVRGDG